MLIRLSSHDDETVRYHVACALPSCSDLENPNDPYIIGTLMSLMKDSCTGVRDHATFALAQLLDADSTQIRDALVERLGDDDLDTRREAMIGLARRRDARANRTIFEALQLGMTDRLTLDAARYMAKEQFLPHLLDLHSEDEMTEERIVMTRRACDPLEVAFATASMSEF